MKEISQELASHVHPDEFVELWKHATKDNKHDFLYVDYEENEPFNLRKNFNTLLTYKPVKQALIEKQIEKKGKK